MIREDSKNYHSWQHRQWVIRTYNLWDQELSFIEQLLNEDLRNNSAWNQRYFVISNTTGYSSDDVIKREIQFALSYIKMAPNNESAWNYLHGVLKGKDISSQQDVREMCDQLISQQVCSPHLMSTMIDIYDEEASRGNNDSLVKAIELCAELSTKIDPIRERYWNYIAKKLKSKHGQIN
jgi:protein farnesyltransferase/geranylgeranyltransferase type-1 subunit alpha